MIDVHATRDGDHGEIVVRDHGPGLSAEGLTRAYDRFWRADAARRGDGSGLGLPIVAGGACEHGGTSSVANAPGGGAVFTLRLPAAPAQPQEQDAFGADSH